MSFRQLASGTTTKLRLDGMLEVRVVTAGTAAPAELHLDGEGRFNRMSDSAFKLLECTGEISVSIRPGKGTDFSSTVSATVQISSGRPGSSAEEIIELPPATLTDNSPMRVATLKWVDDALEISVANTVVGQTVAGFGGIVRSNLRPLIDSNQAYLSDTVGIRVVVDTGAAMSTPALINLIPKAASIITGSVAACSSRDSVELQWGKNHIERANLDTLQSHIAEIVKRGHRYVGGSEYTDDGLSYLTFVISDVAPAVVEFAQSNAIALVLGDNPVDIPADGSIGAIINVGSSLESQISAPMDESADQRHPLRIVSEAISNVVRGELPKGNTVRMPRGETSVEEIGVSVPQMPSFEDTSALDTSVPSSFGAPGVSVPQMESLRQLDASGPKLPESPFQAGTSFLPEGFPDNSQSTFPGDWQHPNEWR